MKRGWVLVAAIHGVSMKSAGSVAMSALGRGASPFSYAVSGVTRKGWRRYFPTETEHEDSARLVEKSWRELHAKDIRLFAGPNVFRIGPRQYAEQLSVDPVAPHNFQNVPTYAQVFALPDLPVLDIIEYCRVGAHNAATPQSLDAVSEHMREMGEMVSPFLKEILERGSEEQKKRFTQFGENYQPWQPVQSGLAEVMKIAPFAIVLAGESVLDAIFLEPVTARPASKIVQLIAEFNPEALETMPQRLQDEFKIDVPMSREHEDLPDYFAATAKYLVASGGFNLWWD